MNGHDCSPINVVYKNKRQAGLGLQAIVLIRDLEDQMKKKNSLPKQSKIGGNGNDHFDKMRHVSDRFKGPNFSIIAVPKGVKEQKP